MAITFIDMNKQSDLGRTDARALQMIREGRELLKTNLAIKATMIDGDGSDAAQFTRLTSEQGFESNALAKASWDELNSVSTILNKPSGQGDAAGQALNQACAKHGI